MKRLHSLFLFLALLGFWPLFTHAQETEITSTLRGTCKDIETGKPLEWATVILYQDSTAITGANTDSLGQFRLTKVPVGRYDVVATYSGYKPTARTNIIVNSGKETVLVLELQESIMETVVIKGNKKGEAINEMSLISTKQFSIEEAERYAGSRGDPLRMASNFAGVSGTDDTRNDLVIRGNSPLGIVYRMEDVNIPNPNHFAVTGSAGGPVGMLNNKVLANSDFMSGAFPAEFGNGIAGAFDLNMRSGNNERHEYTLQVGNFGAEITGEGPLSRDGQGSYLFNYRYATLSFFQQVGIDIGTDAIPEYMDGSFKVNLPDAKGNTLSLWGMGGWSSIDFVDSDNLNDQERDLFATEEQDETFRSSIGVLGASYLMPINDKSYAKFILAGSREFTNMNHFTIHKHQELINGDSLWLLDSLTRKMGFRNVQDKLSFNAFLKHKFNARSSLKAGFFADEYLISLNDSILEPPDSIFRRRMDYDGMHLLLQPYVQWKYLLNENVTLSTGLHGQWWSLNNSWAIEPRAGLKIKASPKSSVNVGVGMHSQLQPTYIYFQQQVNAAGLMTRHNIDLDFSRSLHFVVGYDRVLGEEWRMRAEAYYQHLYGIPIDTVPSSFSMANQGSGFDRFFPGKLVNEGTGWNYGLELTLEKFFSHNWFLMFSSTLFDSKYVASNGRTFNTDFNANYIANVLGTKEFHWGKKRRSSLGIGGRVTVAGGKRYSPIDTTATLATEDLIINEDERNTLQFRPYFRLDLKMNYKVNAKKLTHEVGVDLVNLTSQQNLLRLQYVGGNDLTQEVYQLGFLPIFYYRVDFAFANKRE